MDIFKFKTYKEYLESLATPLDRRLLPKEAMTKMLGLGYRSLFLYKKKVFYKRRKIAFELAYPRVWATKLFSIYLNNDDEVLRALAEREEDNCLLKLSTIIYVQYHRRNGSHVSGYIDYEASLRGARTGRRGATDWKAVFEKRLRLRPKPNHMIYYDWKTGQTTNNETQNFKIMRGPDGIFFLHKADHKAIPVTTEPSEFSHNVQRQMIHSEFYGHVILYDHRIRGV